MNRTFAYKWIKGVTSLITFSELQTRELIHIVTGKRLGFINDLQICTESGRVLSLILYDRETAGMFNKGEEVIVYWEQIVVIGVDVILIRD